MTYIFLLKKPLMFYVFLLGPDGETGEAGPPGLAGAKGATGDIGEIKIEIICNICFYIPTVCLMFSIL